MSENSQEDHPNAQTEAENNYRSVQLLCVLTMDHLPQ